MRTLPRTIVLASTASLFLPLLIEDVITTALGATRVNATPMAEGLATSFFFFDRRPLLLTQGDMSSRLLCENPVVRDKNFQLVTSLALVSTALSDVDCLSRYDTSPSL